MKARFVIAVFFAVWFCGCSNNEENISVMSVNTSYERKTKIVSSSPVHEATLNLPADITLTPGLVAWDHTRNILDFEESQNGKSFIIKRAGLFSNFGEYVHTKNVDDKIRLQVGARAYSVTAPTGGTIQSTMGDKTITGTGTTFSADHIDYDGSVLRLPNGQIIGRVGTLTNDTELELINYPFISTLASVNYEILSPSGSLVANAITIDSLNELYPLSQYHNPKDFNTQIIIPEIHIRSQSAVGNIDFLTGAVPAGLDGEDIFFNVVTEIEYTE